MTKEEFHALLRIKGFRKLRADKRRPRQWLEVWDSPSSLNVKRDNRYEHQLTILGTFDNEGNNRHSYSAAMPLVEPIQAMPYYDTLEEVYINTIKRLAEAGV